MCDTLVALGNSTKNKYTIFAKNSDRDPNEAHYIELIPEEEHNVGEMVKCTYIEVPQVSHTNRVLLAKPFWIWGAEMGSNEFGVTIGNEAVFTKVKDAKTKRLLGMDLLRLALERSESAEEAMYVIIELLSKFGQGGNCGFIHPFYYDNSYLIADSTCAWVLETAGTQWAAEKVKDICSISNRLTIGEKWDLASDDLVHFALDRGWCRKKSDFNFSKCYSDPLMNFFSGSFLRLACTEKSLRIRKGDLTVREMMEVLRTHPTQKNDSWSPDKGLLKSQVCMHVGAGPVRINQTTGSMVSEIKDKNAIHWLTSTSTPCLSIFKPIWIMSPLPIKEPAPTGIYDESALWWRHEGFVREAMLKYPAVRKAIKTDQDEIERNYNNLIDEFRWDSFENIHQYSRKVFQVAEERLQTWKETCKAIPQSHGISLLYLNMLKKINSDAKLRD